MHKLSVKDCLSFGWRTVTARPWLFVGAGIILLIASLLSDMPNTIAEAVDGPEGIVLAVIAFIVSTGLSFLIAMGQNAFFLRSHDSVETASLRDLWHPRPFFKFVGVSILAGAAVLIGLVLLIVPGIIIGIMVGFSLYIVIDRELSPVAAIKESIAITKGNRWNLFLLGLALVGINILGLCALIIGLFITLPLSSLAVVHAYRTLSKPSELTPVVV